MRNLKICLLVGALALASNAQAGTISIEFDLSNSVVSILGGIVTIPPDGAITSASATVNIQGASISAPSGGAASLTGLNIVATVNGTVAAVATLTGGFTANQIGTANGSLTGGLANLAIGTLTLNLTGLINCTPAGPCGVLGSFPISLASTNPITGVGSLGVGGLGIFGAATLNAILNVTIGGNTAVVTMLGQEVNRTFLPSVPEPTSIGLFGMGMLGLAAAGWRRTRR
jgi:hypothetical protein